MNKESKILGDIKRIAELIGKKEGQKLGRNEYLNHTDSKYSHYELYDEGKDWTYWTKQLGYVTKAKREISDKEYFSNLQIAINKLGRLPKVSERKMYGLNFSKRRWPTLIEFIRGAIYNNQISVPDEILADIEKEEQTQFIKVELPEQRIARPEFVPPIPINTKRNKWERTGIYGFPYSPQDESGVIALFAILCSTKYLPYEILELNGGKGVDGILYDSNLNKELLFELKYILSKGSWNHSFDSFDILICWESKWLDFPKPVLKLKDVIKANGSQQSI